MRDSAPRLLHAVALPPDAYAASPYRQRPASAGPAPESCARRVRIAASGASSSSGTGIGESPVLSQATWTAGIFLVSASTIAWSLANPLRIFRLLSDPLPPVVLLQTGRVCYEADRRRPAARGGKHATTPFDIQCLKPSVHGCVAGRIPVTERLDQRAQQVPVRQPCHRFYHCQGRKQRFGVLERRARLVPVYTRYLLVSLRIVPDGQRLTALDVFLVVSHRQPVSDLLIFSFFGL